MAASGETHESGGCPVVVLSVHTVRASLKCSSLCGFVRHSAGWRLFLRGCSGGCSGHSTLVTLSPELLAECQALLDASGPTHIWVGGFRKALKQRTRRAPRPCQCGCGKLEWNHTGMCQASYSRKYRRKQALKRRGRWAFKKLDRRRRCRCGAPARSEGRCNKCWLRHRRRNPKICECGRRFRSIRQKDGSIHHPGCCARCRSRRETERREAKMGRCQCGNRVRYANGRCQQCQEQIRLAGRPLCQCGRGPVSVLKTGECKQCYMTRYQSTERFKVHRRIRERKRQKEKRITKLTRQEVAV